MRVRMRSGVRADPDSVSTVPSRSSGTPPRKAFSSRAAPDLLAGPAFGLASSTRSRTYSLPGTAGGVGGRVTGGVGPGPGVGGEAGPGAAGAPGATAVPTGGAKAATPTWPQQPQAQSQPASQSASGAGAGTPSRQWRNTWASASPTSPRQPTVATTASQRVMVGVPLRGGERRGTRLRVPGARRTGGTAQTCR